MRALIEASLSEIAGRRDEALSKCRSLKREIPAEEGFLISKVDGCIQRLSAKTH